MPGPDGPFSALAFDLDGTLLGPDERVSPANVAAVRAASDAGYAIVLATARWFRLARETADQLQAAGVPMRSPAVACSGAQVRSLSDDQDLFDVRLPAGFVEAAAAITDAQRCIAWAALDDEVVLRIDGAARALPAGLVQHAALADGIGGRAARMLLVQGGDVCARLEAELASEWSDRVRFVESFSSAGKRILTLTAQGADKGRALEAACAALGITAHQVVAFGDAENDLDMFHVAGASVAMGQAGERVLAAATAQSRAGHDDGVAAAIDVLLNGGAEALRGRIG